MTRIVVSHGGGTHDDLRIAEVFGRVSDVDIRAELPELPHRRAFCNIRSLYLVAEIQQHFSYAAHARAADTDHVYGFDFGIHSNIRPCGRRVFQAFLSRARARISSATLSAA